MYFQITRWSVHQDFHSEKWVKKKLGAADLEVFGYFINTFLCV